MLKLTKPDGTPITSYHNWTRPKKDYQWKTGRSAMELAKSWFRNNHPEPPDELLSLLNSNTRLKNIQFTKGIPELVTPLPERGEGRNHDLSLIGCTDKEQITVTIEAKADEPYGNNTILEYWNKALNCRKKGISTRVPERIEKLLCMVDFDATVSDSNWRHTRNQLLTAVCGTILQAQIEGSSLAVLVVHEFITDAIDKNKQLQNHIELENVLCVLSAGSVNGVESGVMYSGFNFDGMDFMIGKIITGL
jgi:hypothetical protein